MLLWLMVLSPVLFILLLIAVVEHSSKKSVAQYRNSRYWAPTYRSPESGDAVLRSPNNYRKDN